eukprot:403350810
MVYDKMLHPDIWNDFFNGISKDQYSIYYHARNEDSFNLDPSFNAQRVETVPSNWGDMGQVRVQIQLLRYALQDPQNQKFIYVSQSCIPLYNFTTFYDKIMSHPYTMLEIIPNTLNLGGRYPRMTELLKNYKDEEIIKHSNWIVFIRSHAQIMVDEENSIIKKFEDVEEPISSPDEGVFGVTLASKGLLSEVWNTVVAHSVWYTSTIHHYVYLSPYHIQTARLSGALTMRKVVEDAIIEKSVYNLIREQVTLKDVLFSEEIVNDYKHRRYD